GAEALALVPAAAADVLLLDIRMPRRSGLEVLAQLAEPRPATLVLTTFDDAELLLAAVRAGARGFLNKDVSLEELVAAIRALSRGDTWFQPALTASLRRGIDERRESGGRGPAGSAGGEGVRPLSIDERREARPHDRSALAERLTDRERDVLRLMAGGYIN